MTRCVYGLVVNTTFADNDDIGVIIQRSKDIELSGNLFVRNKSCHAQTQRRDAYL